jgi:hypothetical protein
MLESPKLNKCSTYTKEKWGTNHRILSTHQHYAQRNKVTGKILSNQLAPYLDQLVSHSQSAFTKGRSIQDNFRYVLGAVNHFHHSETPMLLLKLDIVKDFDSVHWEYLLEIMEQLSFGQRWRHQNPHLEHNIIQNFAKWRSWMPNKTRT